MKMYGNLMNSFAVSVVLWAFTMVDGSGKARVFLLAGQSNMSGAGRYDQLKNFEQHPPEGVKIWHENQWQVLTPGVSANEGRFGPEFAFGRAMKQAYPEDEIYLIKTAAGGTSMHKHWTIENGGGPLLRRFLVRVEAALKGLDNKKVEYGIDGMLWMQGESDASQGKGAEYKKSLRAFIKGMRKKFKQEEMPFIMGRILPTFDKPEGNGLLVRAAQEALAKELKNVACFDTDKFERINKGHYNHNGQIELGKAFARHLVEIVADSQR